MYEHITRTAIHSVKAENIATFLGRKLNGNYRGDMGNHFNTRIEGTSVMHHMGRVAIKMYDKFQMIRRVETAVNDVTFFRQWREVFGRDETSEKKCARVPRHLFSLNPLRKILRD